MVGIPPVPVGPNDPTESRALIPHIPKVAKRTRVKSKVNFGSVMKKIKLESHTKAPEPKTSYS